MPESSEGASPSLSVPDEATGELVRPISVLSTAEVSVRSDWGSDADFASPPAAAAGLVVDEVAREGSPKIEAIKTNYVNAVRSGGRHTLTRLICAKPIHYGVHSIQNLRREMEDAHLAVLGREGCLSGRSLTSDISTASKNAESRSPEVARTDIGSLSFFGVFDGHGGARAAEFAGEQMYSILCRDRATLKQDPQQALGNAFAITESEWLTTARENDYMDGTTAAVALVDRSSGVCIIGNVGDSEILLGTRCHDGKQTFEVLTEVHHLKRNPEEMSRISEFGGRVWHGRLGHPTISPHVLSLSVSRAIGDLFFKDETYTHGKASGLIAEPFLRSVEVCGEHCKEQFLLLGCDGLWDTVSYDQACAFVFQELEAGRSSQDITEGLTGLASKNGSSDNITVILAVLCSGFSIPGLDDDAGASADAAVG
jgi:serine/threonine protein phosphatase PrpC